MTSEIGVSVQHKMWREAAWAEVKCTDDILRGYDTTDIRREAGARLICEVPGDIADE